MDDTASHGKTRSLARLVCLVAVLAIGALMVVGSPAASAEAGGTVMVWGANGGGALGDGSITGPEACVAGVNTDPCSKTPLEVKGLNGVTAVSAGYLNGLALLGNGTVVSWGDNDAGQLGNGGAESLVPGPVSLSLSHGVTVTAVSAGNEYSLALLSNGTVMAWGVNIYGELGDGTTTGPEKCGVSLSCSLTPVAVSLSLPPGVTVTAVSAGYNTSLALLSNGSVMAWGGNLGNGTETGSDVPVEVSLPSGARATAISAGASNSLARLSNGTVMAWGDNGNGMLGNGTETASDVPVAVCEAGAAAPCSAGNGNLLTGVKAVSTGYEQSLALLRNGKVMAWGANHLGELGDGTTTGPETCKDSYPCSRTPVEVKGLSGVAEVSAGELALIGAFHSLARLSNGTVMAWGENQYGQLGNDTTTSSDEPVPVSLSPPSGVTVKAVSTGEDFSLALLSNDTTPPTVASIEPSSGPSTGGTAVTIKGTGFLQGAEVVIGSEASSVEVVSETEIKATTAPAAAGSYEVIVEDANGTSTAGPDFTVEPAKPKLEGIAVDSGLPRDTSGVGVELYVGETEGLTIMGVYNGGHPELLKVPAGEPEPEVRWATEPQPSEAIRLNGVSGGDAIGLTAKEVTSSPGVVQVEYEGFKATSESLNAVIKPCGDTCFEVNGALLNVQAQAPGSTPVAGAIADITQGEAPDGRTSPRGVSEPELPASATSTCTTDGAGACQLIAEEGTEGVAREVEDTITLTAPAGYTVTGLSGTCTSVSGPSEAPVCHLRLPEFSPISTIMFELEPLPTLTVNVGGPEVPAEGLGGVRGSSFDWLNEEVDGTVATITPIDGTPGSPVPCQVEEGEEAGVTGGKQATCSKSLPPGTYEVSVGLKITLNPGIAYGHFAYLTSTDPQSVALELGGRSSVSFNTAYEPGLISSASGTPTGSSTEASATDGPLTATASEGAGTVTVGQYESAPVGTPAFGSESSGKYIDVFLSTGSTFKSLSFTDCELGGGTSLEWLNPEANNGKGEWDAVSDEAYSSVTKCITVTLTEGTSPTLKQLTGTVFGVALAPASTLTSFTPASALSTSLSPSLTSPPATTAASGSVSLDGSSITVQRNGAAVVKLTCTGTATCEGKLALTAKSTTKKGKKKHSKTTTIGATSFSIAAGKTVAVKLALGAAGKASLSAAHGHLNATLTILKSSPAPAVTQTQSVHLAQQKATKAKQGKK